MKTFSQVVLSRIVADEFTTFFTTKIDTIHNDLLVKKKALTDSAKCFTDEVLTMSSTKFSTFTEMKHQATGCNSVLEVLCLGSITIFYHQTMYRPIAAYYY